MNIFNETLANQTKKIDMFDYFNRFVKQFHPNQDLTFMEYFLSLCDEQNDGTFIVHHEKLREYGIMTSTESGDVLKKFDALGLVKSKDYILGDVSENSQRGRGQPAKVYYLTPKAFKLCLMRAQRRPKQTVDPVIYAQYYITLEEIYRYYTRYEKQFNVIREERLLGVKDDRIEELINETKAQSKKMDEQSADIRSMKNLNEAQSKKIDLQSEQLSKLMDHTLDIKATAKRTETYAKATYNSMNTFLGLFIETGTSNSLFKNILARHEEATGNPIENRWFPGVLKMKLLAFVGFYSDNVIYIYSIARNLGLSYFNRLRELYNKHREMTMFQVRVISLKNLL